jgi:transposase-like protein
MSDEPAKLTKRQRQREATRGRRLAVAERRRTVFELVVSGYSYEAIAREIGLSPSALRRDVGKAIAARPIEAPGRYVHLQAARIEKALLAVDAAIERGDVRAVSQYLKVVAALDRYHGLAAALAPSELASAAAPPGLPAPAAPLALTHAAPPLVAEATGDAVGTAVVGRAQNGA